MATSHHLHYRMISIESKRFCNAKLMWHKGESFFILLMQLVFSHAEKETPWKATSPALLSHLLFLSAGR